MISITAAAASLPRISCDVIELADEGGDEEFKRRTEALMARDSWILDGIEKALRGKLLPPGTHDLGGSRG